MEKRDFKEGKDFSTLVELSRYRADSQKDKTAYIFLLDGETQEAKMTYGELDRQARAIAAELQKKFAPGERAILLYFPGLEFISGFFGCLYAGIIAVPVYPPNPADMKKSMDKLKGSISNCQPKIALTTKDIIMKLRLLSVKYSALRKMKWIASDGLKMSSAEKWRQPDIKSDDLAFLQYTSGSTGEPKGVMVSHRNILYNEEMIKQLMGHTDFFVTVNWLPFYHDMGLIGNIFQPMYLGRLSVLLPPVEFLKNPTCWLKALSRYKATSTGGPNFAYDLCAQKVSLKEHRDIDLSTLEMVCSGGEPVRAETIERFTTVFESCGFRRESFFPAYGLAEATLIVTGVEKKLAPPVCRVKRSFLEKNQVIESDSKEKDSIQLVSCGHTCLDQKVLIVDPETLKECCADKIGEIWVKGENVAKGYWNNPEATEKTFNAYLADTGEGPFLRTEDLGFIKDRELFVTGRIKDLIIIRGRNHYPQDIEITVEKSHPAFRKGCCAAFSVDVENEEQLAVVQEIKPDYIKKLDPDQAIKAVRMAVAQNHELDVYAIVFIKPRTIPKTSSGKIQRKACKEIFLEKKLEKVAGSILESSDKEPFYKNSAILTALKNAKPSKAELILTSYLQEKIAHALNIHAFQIDTEESIISLGIDSLKAAELKGKIDEELGIDWEMTKLMEGMSIINCAVELADLLSDINFTVKNIEETNHNRWQQGKI